MNAAVRRPCVAASFVVPLAIPFNDLHFQRAMKTITAFLAAIVLVLGSFAMPSVAAAKDPLFINLTSDDPHRANMAISFGANQSGRGHPLTVFLNDKGVLVGSKANASRYAEQQKKLADLMGKGATVLVCPMCMKHYGVAEADLLPGLRIGSPDVTGGALFRDGTRTLTW
jgi:intracellular sulfur oxidation DsrE/DsrF family protein